MTATLVAQGLAGGYGHRTLFDSLDLTVTAGDVVGLVGANGAGKSTLLKMISGSEPPTSGQVVRECRCSWPLGFAGSFHPNLTGTENIRFASRV